MNVKMGIWSLGKGTREALTEVIFKERVEGREHTNHVDI